jgi:hypothetical protein
MLQNARYSVWFRTPQGEGYGIVSLMDGNVSGGDIISEYTGTMFRTVVARSVKTEWGRISSLCKDAVSGWRHTA